jgi:small-conductance mechanosensitive channel
MDIFAIEFYGNSLKSWLISVGILLSSLILLLLLKRVIVRRLSDFAKRSPTLIDDALVNLFGQTRSYFILAISVYFATLALTFPDPMVKVIEKSIILIALIQGAGWIVGIINFWIRHESGRRLQADAAGATTLTALGFVARLGLWSVIVLLALENVGVDITTLIAGLGIGGVAVALGLQSVLGDLFASLAIVLDKPFVMNDFIVVNEHMGSVEHVGLKTTRIRSLTGEQIIFSNSDLLRSRIRNYGRMTERRVLFLIGVHFQTPHAKLAAIPGLVRSIIEAQPGVRFDRCHFKEFGESSLVFETVFYVKNPDYNVSMDVQHAINLELHRRLGEEGIKIAYPTRVLYMEQGSKEI